MSKTNMNVVAIFLRWVAVLFVVTQGYLWAACSPYIGQATINETHRVNNANQSSTANDYIEFRTLNSFLSSSTVSQWTVTVCDGTNCQSQSLSTASVTGDYWVIYGASFPSDYFDYRDSFSVQLRDENNDLVDYLDHASNGTTVEACSFLYDTTSNNISGNGQRQLIRSPDGIGDWAHPTGNSTPPTEEDTNNDPAVTAQLLIYDAFAAAGTNATVMFELSEPLTSDLTISFTSVDNTATAGSDFTAVNSSVTIPAGSLTSSTDIVILPSADDGENFFVRITSISTAINLPDNQSIVTVSAINQCEAILNQTLPIVFAGTAHEFTQESSGRTDVIVNTSSGSNTYNGTSDVNNASEITSAATIENNVIALPILSPASFPPNNGATSTANTNFSPGNYSTLIMMNYFSANRFSAGNYYIDNLVPAFQGITIEFEAGDYFIDNANLGSVTLRAVEPGVNIYLGGTFKSINLNSATIESSSGNPSDLTFYLYPGAELSLGTASTFGGHIYAYDDGTGSRDTKVRLGDDSDFTGVLFNEGINSFDGDVTINYTDDSYSALVNQYDCAPVIVLPSPVLEYHFDEALWNGTSNEIIDYSGNDLHAAADAASLTSTTTDGAICNAATLNGTDQFIVSPGLAPLQTTSSLSFWIRVPVNYSGDSRPWRGPVVTGYEESGGGDDIFWGSIDGRGRITMSKGNTQIRPPLTSSYIDDNVYHHVVMTWDSATGEANVYLDGLLDHNYTTAAGDVTNAFRWIGLVEDSGNSLVYLNGQLDEFFVFDQILTGPEVSQIYSLQLAGRNLDGTLRSCLGPEEMLAHYVMGESTWTGIGSDVNDSSGAGNDGSSVGSVNTGLYTATCRAGYFSVNDGSAANIYAVDSGLDVDTDIGATGTVEMWVRADENWDAFTRSRNLFDASSATTNFFGSIAADGRIRFLVEDNLGNIYSQYSVAQTYSRADWVHLAYTWDMTTQDIEVFVNGVSVLTEPTKYASTGVGDLENLHFGDSLGLRSGLGTPNAWYGHMADARIYNYVRTPAEIATDMSEFTPCSATLDHFEISHVGPFYSALTCEATAITVTAYLANGTVYDRFTGTVDLSVTNTTNSTIHNGDWSYSGVNVFDNLVADDGAAQAAFSLDDFGVLTLNLANTHAEVVNLGVDYSGITELSGNTVLPDYDENLTFSHSGFQFSLASAPNSAITNVNLVAGQQSDNLWLRAVTTDPATGTCTALFPDATDVTLSIGTYCTDPLNCAIGEQVNWNAVAETVDVPNPQNQSSGSSNLDVNVRFSSNSSAAFNITAPDIGTQPLTVSYPLTDASGAVTETITGILTLQSQPDSLEIFQIDGTLASGFDSSLAFKKAGEPFVVTLRGLDINGDATSSFGRTVTLHDINWANSTVPSPIGGTLGAITGDSLNTSSSAQWAGVDLDSPVDGNSESIEFQPGQSMNYREVGHLNLVAQIDDFMGYGQGAILGNTEIGRFTPAYLSVTENSTDTAAWGTDSSQYQGQPSSLTGLSFTLQAFDVDGNPLDNYIGTYVDFGATTNGLTEPTGSNSEGNPYTDTGNGLTSTLSWDVTDDNDFDGSITLTATVPDLTWQQNSTANRNDLPQTIASFTLLDSAFTDIDGICIKTSDADLSCLPLTTDIADRTLYKARIALPAQVDATSFVANVPVTIEFLSALPASGPEYSVQSIESTLGNGTIAGLDYQLDDACTVSADCTVLHDTADGTLSSLTGIGSTLLNGRGLQVVNSATALSGTSQATVDIPTWLYWDWNNDGTAEAASSLIIWGDYTGRAPLLFIQPSFR